MKTMTLAKLADTLNQNYRIASLSFVTVGRHAVAVTSVHGDVLAEAVRIATAAGFTGTIGKDVASFSKAAR